MLYWTRHYESSYSKICFHTTLSNYVSMVINNYITKYVATSNWLCFYGSTCIAAAGSFWFVGDLNANGWIEPRIAPPPWVFGPVWSVLYILIATSGYLISKSMHGLAGLALGLWCIQITTNTLWTPVFFGAFDLEGALYLSIILWISISLYILVASRASKLAAYFFIPYWFWVSFATWLNYSYLKLNPL